MCRLSLRGFQPEAVLSTVTKIYSDKNLITQSTSLPLPLTLSPSVSASLSQLSTVMLNEHSICVCVCVCSISAGGFQHRNTGCDALIFALTAEHALTSSPICYYGNDEHHLAPYDKIATRCFNFFTWESILFCCLDVQQLWRG